MKLDEQVELFGEFSTRKPGNALFCHQEFLERLEANRNNGVGKRAALLLHRLLVNERRIYYKSTMGANRGWRRSRLGGHGGNQFYAWWAPKGAPPLKDLAEFENAPEQAIFLREIRHHDDHSPLNPHSLEQSYLQVGVKELRQEDYVPAPWTTGQAKFAGARQAVRVVKGYPGSGKTTALWHAADQAAADSVLYVTYSADLAALAREHFEKFSPAHKRFHVVTFGQLVRQILGREAPFQPVHASRRRFVKEISGMSPRILGPWLNSKGALYDEMHAHLVGSALPRAVGRFPASTGRRLSARAYRELRERSVGRGAAEAVLETAEALHKRDERPFEERFFPELCLAWEVVQALPDSRTGALESRGLLGFDCLVLDEAQDLTPLEALVFIDLAAAVQRRMKRPAVLAAGDEAQTVRPTDFEWGWFHDLVHSRIGTPAEFKLGANLRSPRRIAEVVNRVWDLYSALAKEERPGSLGPATIEAGVSDQVVYCAAAPGADLEQLLGVLTEREGLAVISLGEEIPDYVPELLRDRVLTVFEAKGLDFQAVCVLDAGRYLDRITRTTDRYHRELDIEDLSKRLAIDQLRVALSRPTERLYWLDVNPSEKILDLSRRFLSGGTAGTEVFPVIPAAVLKMLEEELLLPEDRVRLCESDARQLLEVKPAMAWTRAQQAVALAESESADAIDENVRRSAHLTLAEVAFLLAYRKAALGSELGRPNLYGEAARHVALAGKKGLAEIIASVGSFERCEPQRKTSELILAMSSVRAHRTELEPWLAMELAPRVGGWIERLEACVDDTFSANMLVDLLPAVYEIFQLPDAVERAAKLRQKSVEVLMGKGSFKDALDILRELPNPDPALMAACHEGAGDYRAAAECHLAAGNLKEALRNYRAIPDFGKALELIGRIGEHPAAESLRWIERMRALAAERPAEFNKVVLPAEKKLLEEILEASLGVTRKKPAAKKTAAKRGRPRKTLQNKAASKS